MKKPDLPKVSLPTVDFRALLDDFRGLNPKDFGTWPLAPRIAVLAGVFVAIIAAGWWFIWKDQLETLDGKRAEEAQLREEFVAKKTQAVNLDLYVQQLAEIDRSFGALLKQLPNKSEVESLLVEINQAGMGRGLQFELFKPGQEVLRDFYAELPINVRLTGSYHDFGAFAGDIGRLSRIVTLNNVAISAAPGSGGLTMDAVTKTFRYLDDEEVARQRKAAQAAKGAK
ncbi:type IV pilus inner membrane component PilO [Rhodocyclus tenuis]|uniref:Type IV pilus assembly protein PilO n=1 Tax=Rhodocyclus tenuis TaxID=1066 RepID=A0A840G203_RHOTE|nr:type 4a pilus biogenesis protein PilO [Rhodocyclus tenuis]MBB4245975.1 type IV pilus assembly protein PilO [Rhodocyclus tenuis]